MQKHLLILLFVIITANIYAQDFGFGFADDAGEAAPSGSAISVKFGGEIAVALSPYVYGFGKKSNTQEISFWDMISGKLNFRVSGGNIEAFSAFNLNAAAISELWNASSNLSNPSYTPLIMDEAYLRAFIGPVNIEAGLRKIIWGKADSLGPLDVINPLDYTDLRNLTDIQSVKIARPLVHVSWNAGGFSKLEGVFIPNFAGHRFDQKGRWAPSQFSAMTELAGTEILNRVVQRLTANIPPEYFPALLQYLPGIQSMFSELAAGFSPEFPNTSGLEYFQAGLRYTTTAGSADIGAQYFYGSLFQPDVTMNINGFVDDLISGNGDLINMLSSGNFAGLDSLNPDDLYTGDTSLLARIKYNRYHQLGIDYAQVLFGFNVRSEFAVFLTKDLKGSDGMVRNPFLGWSLGFDRDLFWGINANVQCNETIRLMNNKVGKDPLLDCEAGTNVTSTRLTMQISKKFLRDELESRVIVIWDIENSDCYVIPACIWTMSNFSVELSGGIFAGKKGGDLGQYWENSYVKLGIKYSL